MEAFGYFQKYFDEKQTVKIVFSSSKEQIKKIIVKPVKIKNEIKWQLERQEGTKVFHLNLSMQEFLKEVRKIISNFKQIMIINTTCEVQILNFEKKAVAKVTQTEQKTQNTQHNKIKNYIFCEGQDIAPLRDLGVFSADNRLVKAKADKFRQINRFIEIIDDEFKSYPKDEIVILDFGCGKSYLTFLIYYYFKFIKKIKIKVVGYDLKPDVVADCNSIAKKYGYDDLKFINADVAGLNKSDYKVDMIITLHACDTATDYALYNAIKNDIKYVFSVPCCQHEINAQIKSSTEMQLILKDGLIKERFSALLTDAIRCEILRECGYKVDVIEFVDFSHSPKNLMIRATSNKSKRCGFARTEALLKSFGCKQKLFTLITEDFAKTP